MIDEEVRDFLKENCPDAIIFNTPAYDRSIVGISSEHNIIYDLNKMVEELSKDNEISEDEAFEFIENDTMRLLSYIEDKKKPLIVDFSIEELYN